MSKIDITSHEWCDIIFEGKNKAFGAYTLRSQSPRRHNQALLIVVVITVFLFGSLALVKMVFQKKDQLVVTEVTTLSKLPEAEEKKEEQPKINVPPPPPLKSSIKFTAPVIKKDEEVKEVDEIKAQDDMNKAKAAISIADIKGTDEVSGKDIAEVKEVVEEKAETPFVTVEQMPSFPGGEGKLMDFISRNLRYPVVAMENGIQGRVIIRFVVSRTGDISNVEVMRGVDPSCDAEAVRVVKMMPRWIPGKQNGDAVPVYFVLPIMFKLQN